MMTAMAEAEVEGEHLPGCAKGAREGAVRCDVDTVAGAAVSWRGCFGKVIGGSGEMMNHERFFGDNGGLLP
jgi:hypothetical protein